MSPPTDHIIYVMVAFIATLACFTTVSIVGSDGFEVLRDVMLTLAGVLGGVAVGTRTQQPPK